LRPFTLVTGNHHKRAEVERILGFPVPCAEIELPEIQSLDLAEVLRAKAREAHRRLDRGVVVEETGLELQALGGFPGPLVKWMLAAVGAPGIARTALALGDPGAVARCQLLYWDGCEEVFGEGVSRGQLVLPPRGGDGFGWDPVFVPEGSDRTFAELGPREKDRTGHRGRAWRSLLEHL
jgi:non-canonical purine NTP pyrophosphatase (RdgB/HAM1 family)